MYGIPKSPQEPCSSYTLPTMPRKLSTYGDITTTHTETDAHEPQAAITTDKQHEERNPTAEETQLEEDNAPEANTPLPTTPIQCSTSHGPRHPRGMTTNKPLRFAQMLPPKDCRKRKKQTKKKVKVTLRRQN